MVKRKLEELHLLDDFLFGSMVSHPQVGEEFIKLLLKIIFGREFGKMTVVPQKFYYGADTDKHGARILFLYTKGTEGNPPEELRQLLHYMENTIEENAVNDELKFLNDMVNIVKHDKEVSLNYMKTMEWEEMLINQGQEQERVNTERERLRADSEAQRADFESARAERAEKELELLKKKLASLKFSS